MIISFIILNISIIAFIGVIWYFKEHHKTYPLYALFLLMIFYFPSIYYILGGTSYKVFDDSSFAHYMYYSTLIFWINMVFLVLKNSTMVKPMKNDFLLRIKGEPLNYFVIVYFGIIILVILGYIAIYFDKFPLISFVFSGRMINRPDFTGSLPHFYTLSTIMLYIVPSIYFYLYPRIKSSVINVVLLASLAVILTISGHKSSIVFFAIFYWYYILGHKLNFKLIGILLVLVIAYAITKGINNLNEDTFVYLINSPIRRFFVTQGACMIVRFHMIDINYIFDAVEPIKNQVCNVMNSGANTTCSAPTFFIGDLLVKYGFLAATFIYIASVALVFWVLKNIDVHYPDSLFVKWNLFCLFFLTGMVEINLYSFMRILLFIVHVYLTCLLANLTFNFKSFANKINWGPTAGDSE